MRQKWCEQRSGRGGDTLVLGDAAIAISVCAGAVVRRESSDNGRRHSSAERVSPHRYLGCARRRAASR
eukprot:CAMPEP_0119071156 /NCGR_PEP_ID=MMETSP1178-20130426/48491_1 /TAXON_ID=33656 /ORGANISM="unid sp, Strain CCMP2000" /LENGTH=67 /DNA_ID=CAMNT_0007053061 /DNA_START=44 /DNA_END=243 /DNA_ORIENTATION=-